MEKNFDYIIAGAGLAGLSLAYKIRLNPKLDSKSILLVDKDQKSKNDRTWCFWSKENELFDEIVYKKWSNITYASDDFSKDFDILPYAYKMIRGIDFYNFVLRFLKKAPNVTFCFESIESVSDEGQHAVIKTDNNSFRGNIIFKSFYDKIDFSQSHFVWQHFKGVIIETPEAKFNPNKAMFMDFRVDQEKETRFFYQLPISETKALVELAIFSSSIPEPTFYDSYINDYLKNILNISDYKIIEEELGAIPMTTFNFNNNTQKRIINIGTNGGSVKASSGYAFKRIQEETDRLIHFIIADTLNKYKPVKNRFGFYDKIMLNAILSKKTTGQKVFDALFKKLKPQTIFKFLDEKGSFFNDLKIFSAPPTLPFLKAFFEELKPK
ncbi:MAG: lycopene cyclase [Saprospiraceae bacterium]|nr:lycopene cyclase [Saprospiraceae bacterium]